MSPTTGLKSLVTVTVVVTVTECGQGMGVGAQVSRTNQLRARLRFLALTGHGSQIAKAEVLGSNAIKRSSSTLIRSDVRPPPPPRSGASPMCMSMLIPPHVYVYFLQRVLSCIDVIIYRNHYG